jgi:hypothetical protein
MTDDIRDRLAEWIETHRSYDPESFGIIVESLAALVGQMLLSERAAALGAAKKVIVELRYDNASQSVEECEWDDALGDAYRAIDAISPEDWIGVRAEDLAGLVDAARGAVSAAELVDRDRATDAGFLLALRMADALRAALARLP